MEPSAPHPAIGGSSSGPRGWQLVAAPSGTAPAQRAALITAATAAAAAAATVAGAPGNRHGALLLLRCATSLRAAAPGGARHFCAATGPPAAGAAHTTAAASLPGGGGGLSLLCGRRSAAAAPGLGLEAPLGRAWRGAAVRRLATQPAGQQAVASAASAASGLRRLLPRGRLGEALRLQAAAAWQSYGSAVYVLVAVTAVYLLWRIMYGVTSAFIGINQRLAEYGMMGLAAALVLLATLYLRWRVAVNPAAVYRQAMVRLNTHPGVLEVMGAPLVGSDVRAYVVTGGGLYLSKRLRPKLRARRIQMMFPLSGGERRGLVSLEAKRKQGKYDWRLLAVDLGPELQAALPAGGSQALSAAPPPRQPVGGAAAAPAATRVYVLGDAASYGRGGVLGELRAPFLQALSNSRSYEVEDELEDELEELALPAGGRTAAALTGGAASVLRGARQALASASTLLGPKDPAAAAAAAAQQPAKQGAAAAAAGPAAPAAVAPPAPPVSSSAAPAAPAAPAASATRPWWDRVRSVMAGPGAAPEGK